MTTIKIMKLKCSDCGGHFLAQIPRSFGFRGVDENLCREYWGYNPMLTFITMCPHCGFIDHTSRFEMTNTDGDSGLPKASQTCETFSKFAAKLEKENAEPLAIARLYHQGGCCLKIQGLNHKDLLKKANEFYKRAKDARVDDSIEDNIDSLIERTSV